MSDNKEQPRAYMRKWAFDGEAPYKVNNENNRLAYPKKFLLKDVTVNKVLVDDVPLYAAAQPVVLSDDRILDIAYSEGISFVTDERRPDNATIISFARAILAAKEQA